MKAESQANTGKCKPKTKRGLEHRKRDVLTRQTPSIVASIANALVIKDDDLYFLCEPDGEVPRGLRHGFGLYYQDTRYLNTYTLRMGRQKPRSLVAANRGGFKAVVQLANPQLRVGKKGTIGAQTIGVNWSRMLKGEQRCLYDVLTFQNYGLTEVELPVSMDFGADFEDVFDVRGLVNEHPGKVHPPRWATPQMLWFQYDGADEVVRRVSVYFSECPERGEQMGPAKPGGPCARFRIKLKPGESRELMVAIEVSATPASDVACVHATSFPDLEQVEKWLHKSSDDWIEDQAMVHSDAILLNRIMERSLRDLHTLRSELDGYSYFAAGVPWFATLFGRDSLITALQTLAYNPRLAEGALKLLAEHQGVQVDPWRDEQPGKILHEYRAGELAHLKAIPHDPYYGTVDATALFLIVLARHAQWTGSTELFDALRSNVERALTWIDQYGDSDGDGYVDYTGGDKNGLVNQGWKDSGNAIVNTDGSLAKPPISLVEVQGYVYMAKREIADLYERMGDAGRAHTLRQEAGELRRRFNKDFWMPKARFFALALQADGKQAAVISSNPGQALWTGIVDKEKARHVERRLMAPDMFNGWGVRTLSTEEKRYNPNSYHLGSVWPHDNALIAAGLRRYGFDSAARRIFRGLFDAASHFDQYRMPELFTGFNREDYGEPVRYPVACHPQAWAAGSLPYMLTVMLGLQPAAFDRKLRVVRPLLPDFVDVLELHRVRVGEGHISLRFHRDGDHTAVTVLHSEHVDLEVEE